MLRASGRRTRLLEQQYQVSHFQGRSILEPGHFFCFALALVDSTRQCRPRSPSCRLSPGSAAGPGPLPASPSLGWRAGPETAHSVLSSLSLLVGSSMLLTSTLPLVGRQQLPNSAQPFRESNLHQWWRWRGRFVGWGFSHLES